MTKFEFPCDVNDIVYVAMKDYSFPVARKVCGIRIGKNWEGKHEIRFALRNVRTGEMRIVSIDDFNKTVFINKNDAMKAIKNNT